MKQVEPGQGAGSATGNAGDQPEQDATAAAARDLTALRREMELRNLPAGPTPAFEMSLLEVEQDIRQVLARIEATRSQARESAAVKAEAHTTPPPEADTNAPSIGAIPGDVQPPEATIEPAA